MTRARDVADSSLAHIKTVEIGTTVSSVSADNLFTDEYAKFLVLFNYNAASTSHDLYLRVRVNGSDRSAANTYRYATIQRPSSATAVSVTQSNGQTYAYMGTTGGGSSFWGNLTISNARNANEVGLCNLHNVSGGVGETMYSEFGSFALNINDVFDGITIYPSTGTISDGKIISFGIRE